MPFNNTNRLSGSRPSRRSGSGTRQSNSYGAVVPQGTQAAFGVPTSGASFSGAMVPQGTQAAFGVPTSGASFSGAMVPQGTQAASGSGMFKYDSAARKIIDVIFKGAKKQPRNPMSSPSRDLYYRLMKEYNCGGIFTPLYKGSSTEEVASSLCLLIQKYIPSVGLDEGQLVKILTQHQKCVNIALNSFSKAVHRANIRLRKNHDKKNTRSKREIPFDNRLEDMNESVVQIYDQNRAACDSAAIGAFISSATATFVLALQSIAKGVPVAAPQLLDSATPQNAQIYFGHIIIFLQQSACSGENIQSILRRKGYHLDLSLARIYRLTPPGRGGSSVNQGLLPQSSRMTGGVGSSVGPLTGAQGVLSQSSRRTGGGGSSVSPLTGAQGLLYRTGGGGSSVGPLTGAQGVLSQSSRRTGGRSRRSADADPTAWVDAVISSHPVSSRAAQTQRTGSRTHRQ